MQAVRALVIVSVLAVACGKESTPAAPTFTSAAGKWTYTTPDTKISVEFELQSSMTPALVIKNPASIVVAGISGAAVAQMFDVNLPAIDSIRISANDSALTYPYFIAFSGGTVAADFTNISVSDVTYSYPYGTTKTLSGAVIQRKP